MVMEREFILSEVRRCAENNGGVALGRIRFEAETGIVVWNWCGKYWGKWSELVREAGYEPGSMSIAHEDEYLLRHLALLVQELGRWPTTAQRKRRGGPT